MSNKAITPEEAESVIHQWASLLDQTNRVIPFLPILSETILIRFGVQEWHGLEGFEDHQRVKGDYFNETHQYTVLESTIVDGEAIVKTKAFWEAHYREPFVVPARCIRGNFRHTWKIVRSTTTGLPVIQEHIVDSFEFEKGFEPPQPKVHITEDK